MVNNGLITAPISVKDPYTCMGVGATANGYDLGYICSNSHGKINWRSLYKPVKSSKISELTDSDYFNLNFGYTIPVYGTYSAMKNGITNGWTYNPPTGGDSSPYRLTDFNRYNHKATAPFNLELISGNPNLGGQCTISCPTDIMWLTNWNTWSGFQGTNIQYLNCGFYVPGIGYWPLTDTDQGLSIPDLDMDKLSFTATSTYFTAGKTYQVYLILTTWDGRNGARQWYNPDDTVAASWWVLATDQPLSITVQQALNPLQYITVNGNGTASMSLYDGYYAWRTVNINLNVSVSSSYTGFGTGSLLVSIIIPNHYPGSGTSTQSKTILQTTFSGITSGFNQSVSKSASDFNVLSGKDEEVNATMELRLTIGTATYTRTENIIIYAN